MTALELAPDGHPTVEQLGYSWLAGHHTPRTREIYAGDLEHWLRFCHDVGVHPLDADRTAVDAWVLAQIATNVAPASVKRRLSAVRGWYDHLHHDLELVTRNPTTRVTPPKVHRTPRVPVVGAEQAATLARLAAEDGPDFELAFRLMFCNALRLAEVETLRTGSVMEAPNGELYATVVGKGDKPRVAVFSGRTAHLLRLVVWPPMTRASQPTDRPVVEIARRRLERHVAAWGRKAGVQGRLFPHALRHAGITIALHDPAVKLEDVQDMAGHADPRTTRHYDRDAHSVERNPSRVIERAIEEAGE